MEVGGWAATMQVCGLFLRAHTVSLCPSRSFHDGRDPDVGETGRIQERSIRMPFLRTHCDILPAAPPRAGHGRRSRGAVCLGQGNRVPKAYLRPVARAGVLRFCRGGRLDGQRTTAPDRKRGGGPLAWSCLGLSASITPACAELGAELGARSTRESFAVQTGGPGPRALSKGASTLRGLYP